MALTFLKDVAETAAQGRIFCSKRKMCTSSSQSFQCIQSADIKIHVAYTQQLTLSTRFIKGSLLKGVSVFQLYSAQVKRLKKMSLHPQVPT